MVYLVGLLSTDKNTWTLSSLSVYRAQWLDNRQIMWEMALLINEGHMDHIQTHPQDSRNPREPLPSCGVNQIPFSCGKLFIGITKCSIATHITEWTQEELQTFTTWTICHCWTILSHRNHNNIYKDKKSLSPLTLPCMTPQRSYWNLKMS